MHYCVASLETCRTDDVDSWKESFSNSGIIIVPVFLKSIDLSLQRQILDETLNLFISWNHHPTSSPQSCIIRSILESIQVHHVYMFLSMR